MATPFAPEARIHGPSTATSHDRRAGEHAEGVDKEDGQALAACRAPHLRLRQVGAA